jgi:hypothetical protein
MKINIGNFGRWGLRQLLGTRRGQEVIDALESGLWESFDALRRRDFGAFWESLPSEWRVWIITEVRKKVGL